MKREEEAPEDRGTWIQIRGLSRSIPFTCVESLRFPAADGSLRYFPRTLSRLFLQAPVRSSFLRVAGREFVARRCRGTGFSETHLHMTGVKTGAELKGLGCRKGMGGEWSKGTETGG